MLKVIKSEIFAWVEALICFMPGKIGGAFRRSWYKNHFQDCNEISIGMGCNFISPQTMAFNGSVAIGERSLFVADGGSIFVGGETTFNSNVHINASVGGVIQIGETCLIGPNVIMRTAGHRFDDPSIPIRQQGHIVKNITIGDNVWIGSNAIVLGGVQIGSGSVIGAGAVVVSDIPQMSVAVGIPARVIRSRESYFC
jgi:carbonic anhydrase/acetyltransferase-like protein (isoleucine patch superfamily)